MSDTVYTKITEPADGDCPAGTIVLFGDSATDEMKAKNGDTKIVVALGDDKKVKISVNDTTPKFLEDAVVEGSGVTIIKLNTGANEQLQFSSSEIENLNPTGLVFETSGVVTVNSGDASLYDITETKYFIQGVFYTFTAVTGIDPQFGSGENSSWIGLNSSGLVYKSTKWTTTELKTIIPVARLNTASGVTGPGSDISLLRDDRYLIDQQGWRDRNYREKAFGALYFKGGLISESSTVLQLDQSAGVLFDAQGKEQTLSSIGDIDAIKVFHTGGIPDTSNVSPLIVDVNNYDNGTDLTAIPSNKWVCHTLLKSPKGSPQEGGFFFIYADVVYNNQTEAEACSVNWSIFSDQATSGLVPVARIIVQQGAASIGVILDERPFAVGGTGGQVTAVTPTLQQVYEASIIPQLSLNSTQGLLDIRDSAIPLGTDLFAIKNSDGTTIFFKVNSSGISINQGLLTALPFSFDGDSDTGIYSVGGNQMAFVAAGVEKLTISTSQMKVNVPFRAANGTVSAPIFSFTGMTNGGYYRVSGDNTLRMAHEGVDSVIYKANNIVNLPGIPEYADDSAAGTGGLVTDDLYRTAAGEMRIKL